MNGKQWSELTEEEHQRFPADHEAQVGHSPITLHSDEQDIGVSFAELLVPRGRSSRCIRVVDEAAWNHSGCIRDNCPIYLHFIRTAWL